MRNDGDISQSINPVKYLFFIPELAGDYMLALASKKVAGDYVSYAAEKTVKNISMINIIRDERSAYASVADDDQAACSHKFSCGWDQSLIICQRDEEHN